MIPVIRRNGGVQRMWTDPSDLVQREMDRVFNRFFAPDTPTQTLAHYPVDIYEDENHIFVDAEMPGFRKDDVDVTLEAGVLTITAERKSETDTGGSEKAQHHLTERRYSRVQRSFSMPSSVDDSKVEATLSDGVLHLKLHKREEVKPRKITVK